MPVSVKLFVVEVVELTSYEVELVDVTFVVVLLPAVEIVELEPASDCSPVVEVVVFVEFPPYCVELVLVLLAVVSAVLLEDESIL